MPLPGVERPGPLRLDAAPLDEPYHPVTITSAVSVLTTGWPLSVGAPQGEDSRRREITRLLREHYPSLAGAQFPAQGPVEVSTSGGETTVRLLWPVPQQGGDETRAVFVAELGAEYRRRLLVLPALPGHTRPHHPLVLWWALL